MTVHFFFQYANIWQIAVTAVIVQAISDDERVGDFKPVVIDRDIYFAARWLAKKRRNPDRTGTPFQEEGLQLAERNACIDDIFDNQDITASDITVQIFTDLDEPRRRRLSTITGANHEIEFDRAINTACQIGKERDGAL